MELILPNVLIVGGVLFFFTLLRSAANRPAKRDRETGELILQCSPVLVWSMGIIAVGGPLAMGVLSFVIPFEHPAQVFVPVVIGAFFLLLGGLMSYWAVSRRTRIGEKGLTSEYMFIKPRFLPWSEVNKVSFASGQEFWVCSKKQKAMLHVWFVGVNESVGLLEKYLPAEVQKKDKAVLERFTATVGTVEVKLPWPPPKSRKV